MHSTTAETAQTLGISTRQVRQLARQGSIAASRHGRSYFISHKEVTALQRTKHRGRSWSGETSLAALDLLTLGSTSRLGAATERSRLKARLRLVDVGTLAGQILRGRVTLRRCESERRSSFNPSIATELGLAGVGLGILVAENSNIEARRNGLWKDDDGNVVVVEGLDRHRKVLEALAVFAYGDSREEVAAAGWLQHRMGQI